MTGEVPWRSFLAEARRRLGAVEGIDQPELEARWIVEEAAGQAAGSIASLLDEPATVRGVAHFDDLLSRREAGEPMQYVLGHWPFRRLDLAVDRRALIPRPETEVVTGAVLTALVGRRHPLVVDLGTGSGAIGLSVLAEHDTARVIMTDLSADAVALARSNLAGLGMRGARGTILEGSWFDALPDELSGAVDLVVSNPPYVGHDEHLDRSVLDWEPAGALFADRSGLADAEHLVTEARSWLTVGGRIVVEHGAAHGPALRELATLCGYTDVETGTDLAGVDRFLTAVWATSTSL